MNYHFVIKNTESKESILNELNILIPTNDNYKLGFKLKIYDYSYYVIIHLIKGEERNEIYTSQYYYENLSSTISKVSNLLIESQDKIWNYGLEKYREETTGTQKEETESEKLEKEIKKYRALDGRKYAKLYSFNERKELKKIGYYKIVIDPWIGGNTFFEKILAKASKYEKMDFKKLKLLTLGYYDYAHGKSNNILLYAEYFLSADTIEKIRELSILDANTSVDLFDVKKMIEEEEKEYNRICEITAQKKEIDLKQSLENEHIKYMVKNGISLTEAFYQIDKDAQTKKKNILNCYIKLSNNENVDFSEDIIFIAKYLLENVEKRFVEKVIDLVLMDVDLNTEELSDNNLNHISYLKLKIRSDITCQK